MNNSTARRPVWLSFPCHRCGGGRDAQAPPKPAIQGRTPRRCLWSSRFPATDLVAVETHRCHLNQPSRDARSNAPWLGFGIGVGGRGRARARARAATARAHIARLLEELLGLPEQGVGLLVRLGRERLRPPARLGDGVRALLLRRAHHLGRLCLGLLDLSRRRRRRRLRRRLLLLERLRRALLRRLRRLERLGRLLGLRLERVDLGLGVGLGLGSLCLGLGVGFGYDPFAWG